MKTAVKRKPCSHCKDLIRVLEMARPHVQSQADAEHILDGFGPKFSTVTDIVLHDIDLAIVAAKK